MSSDKIKGGTKQEDLQALVDAFNKCKCFTAIEASSGTELVTNCGLCDFGSTVLNVNENQHAKKFGLFGAEHLQDPSVSSLHDLSDKSFNLNDTFDIVVAKFMNKWYAPRIKSLEAIPGRYYKQVKASIYNQNQDHFCFVKFFSDGLYYKIHRSNIDVLEWTKKEKLRGQKDNKGYKRALQTIKRDIHNQVKSSLLIFPFVRSEIKTVKFRTIIRSNSV